MHGIVCYYDPAHALVGARLRDDIDTFCGRTSPYGTAGIVPPQ